MFDVPQCDMILLSVLEVGFHLEDDLHTHNTELIQSSM